MKHTQSLGNTPYSISHKGVLVKKDRERVAKQLISILQDSLGKNTFKNLKAIDVGCSGGTITNLISNYAGKTVGVDVDKHAIRQAILNHCHKKNLSFKHTKGTTLPYANKSFDIVICNQVYSYTTKPNKLMNEIYRVLKKEGICLFTGDNLLRLTEPLYKLPLIRWLPENFVKYYLKKKGYKKIYIGRYKTYWGIKKMCNKFIIDDYTVKVLKKPEKYKFTNLIKCKNIVNMIPHFVLKLFEPLFPTFIFILKKY